MKLTNTFNQKALVKKNIGPVIDKTVVFLNRRKKKIPTSEFLKADALIKVLMELSADMYSTKTGISDKLLNDIFDTDNLITPVEVAKRVEAKSGYVIENPVDYVYLLVWFSFADEEPKYKNFNEFRNAQLGIKPRKLKKVPSLNVPESLVN